MRAITLQGEALSADISGVSSTLYPRCSMQMKLDCGGDSCPPVH